MKGEEYIPPWLNRPYGNYFDAGGILPDGAGVVYRDAPVDEEQLSKYYVDYFDQMNKRNSKAWNKGRIDDISPKALSLRW